MTFIFGQRSIRQNDIEYYYKGLSIREDGKIYRIYVNENNPNDSIQKLIYQIVVNEGNENFDQIGQDVSTLGARIVKK